MVSEEAEVEGEDEVSSESLGGERFGKDREEEKIRHQQKVVRSTEELVNRHYLRLDGI